MDSVFPNDTKSRFWRKLHLELEELSGGDSELKKTLKEELKDKLKRSGMIGKSTKELNLKGLAIAYNTVVKWRQRTNNLKIHS